MRSRLWVGADPGRLHRAGNSLSLVPARGFPHWIGADPPCPAGACDDRRARTTTLIADDPGNSTSRRVGQRERKATLASLASGTRQGDAELEDRAVGGHGEQLAARPEAGRPEQPVLRT